MNWVKTAVFIGLVLLIWGALHFYIYRSLLGLFPNQGKARPALLILFFLLFASFPVAKLLARVLPPSLAFPIYFLASLWLALVFYLFLYLLAGDLLGILIPARSLLKPAMVALAVLTVAYGFFEAGSVAVRNFTVVIPAARAGKVKIVHLSDLHLGLNLNYLRLRKIIPKINDFSPDLVLITGDLVDEEVKRAGECRVLFRKIKAKYGIFAVSGNHEFYAGEKKSFSLIKSWGVKLLRNEAVEAGDVVLAGVDDEEFLRKGWKETLKRVLARAGKGKPLILLKHRPTGFDIAREMGVSLMLCGHTHRAQLFPLHLITAKVYRYFYGYHREGEMHIYVNSGLGTWGPPIRVLARPEVAFITLRLKPPSK